MIHRMRTPHDVSGSVPMPNRMTPANREAVAKRRLVLLYRYKREAVRLVANFDKAIKREERQL